MRKAGSRPSTGQRLDLPPASPAPLGCLSAPSGALRGVSRSTYSVWYLSGNEVSTGVAKLEGEPDNELLLKSIWLHILLETGDIVDEIRMRPVDA
jgi:hypothetical protein